MAYAGTGVGAVRGEAEKRRSWDVALRRRAESAPAGVEFVPFSLEASEVWGPAARRFCEVPLPCGRRSRHRRLFHWRPAKFSSTWHDTFSILLARGRAQLSHTSVCNRAHQCHSGSESGHCCSHGYGAMQCCCCRVVWFRYNLALDFHHLRTKYRVFQAFFSRKKRLIVVQSSRCRR
jgi:hypothetical protein